MLTEISSCIFISKKKIRNYAALNCDIGCHKTTRNVHGSEMFRTVRVWFEIPAFELFRTCSKEVQTVRTVRTVRTSFETTKSLITTN